MSFVSQKLYPVLVKFTKKISEKFLPQGGAYQEIWLNKSKILEKKDNVEPIYGAQYLPRKFKIAIAIPPFNDVDVYANDIGLVAIVEKEKLIGFNIMVMRQPMAYLGCRFNWLNTEILSEAISLRTVFSLILLVSTILPFSIKTV